MLFTGPGSLRDPAERLAFWLTALCAFPAALLIGYALHESIGASQVALFIVIAMLYVTLARGRLLGLSVHVHETQYPRVFTIVKRACAALEIPMPLVFVREDNYVPVVALGFGEPYALVLSTHWIEVFDDDELAFMVGCELGHIAAGHTRFLSLLSVNGRENPLISLVFGGWLRRCALTCDKVGLLCCGSIDASVRAMGVAAFHEFSRKVDYQAFAEQQADIQSDPVLRLGEWLGAEPYATRRIASLRRFIASRAFADAAGWFARERSEEPPVLAAAGGTRVATRDCAGWWRRFSAWAIDAVVVSAIITSFGGSVAPVVHRTHAASTTTTASSRPVPRASATPSPSSYVWVNPLAQDPSVITSWLAHSLSALGFQFWFPAYLALLVIVAGQTFGMMIVGLRVVTTDFRKPSIWRILARYFIVFCLWWLIVPLSLIWRRILLQDRWTDTRVVKVERVVARAAGGS